MSGKWIGQGKALAMSREQCDTLNDKITELRRCLIHIMEYKPNEVCKDAFAYDRMVEAYRKAAHDGLVAT